uniref:Uncharacterized protein n=1 Tax=Candidatus Kentrum sp. TC TaxID=2126339 RepID=A0A450YK21_9GAMM|nr:MAG: hypothetical protein BECKTC1821E_GA0114239_101517 [Candidatus Kentron sp. TC]
MQGKSSRRDKGSSANIYPALTDEATSSFWPRWISACSDLIETAALEMASSFLRFLGNTGSTFLYHHSTLSTQLHDGKLERDLRLIEIYFIL